MSSQNLHALLYVSNSRLPPADAFSELQSIVQVSVANNGAREISGALMFTEENFLQYLEGPISSLQALLLALRADARHENLRLLLDRPTNERLFGSWALAYYGPPDFVRAEVAAALDDGSEAAKSRLIDMMVAFASAGGSREI
jgi:hypothetical protein